MTIKTELDLAIEEILSLKQGNQEMMFSFDPCDNLWELHLGNLSGYVALGEVEGQFQTEGATMIEAAVDMIEMLCECIRNSNSPADQANKARLDAVVFVAEINKGDI